MTVTTVTPSFVRPKRAKFGVAVPPLMNEPMTAATPPSSVMVPVDFSKIVTRPPPSMTAVTIE